MYRIILNSIKLVKGIGTIHDDFKTICLKQYIIYSEIVFIYLYLYCNNITLLHNTGK